MLSRIIDLPLAALSLLMLARPALGQQRSSGPAGGGNYVLRAGDEIGVNVVGEPEFKGRIADDGTISHPLLRKVSVAGKTVYTAEEHIVKLLKDGYILQPQVTVQVTDVKLASITVLGWVAKAGNFEFSPAEGLDVVKALGLAGGCKPGAVESAVWVTRKGGSEKLKVERSAMPQFQLKPGDTVEVKRSVF